MYLKNLQDWCLLVVKTKNTLASEEDSVQTLTTPEVVTATTTSSTR